MAAPHPPSEYQMLLTAAIQELQANVARAEVAAERLVAELAAVHSAGRRVAVYGVGREGLAIKALLMRLHHMGMQASVVGEMTASHIGAGDLLIASAGPGWFSTVEALAGQARRSGARVLLLTSRPPEAAARAAAVADVVLQVPATCLPAAERSEGGAAGGAATGPAAAAAGPGQLQAQSQPQPQRASPLLMGSSYELALQLFFDLVCVLLQERLGLTAADMEARHTNLE